MDPIARIREGGPLLVGVAAAATYFAASYPFDNRPLGDALGPAIGIGVVLGVLRYRERSGRKPLSPGAAVLLGGGLALLIAGVRFVVSALM